MDSASTGGGRPCTCGGTSTGQGTFGFGGAGGGEDDLGASVHVTVVMTLETLLGLRDDPAYLDRYGPIAAHLARDLATNGTFRCAAIDDVHATILGLGHPTHRTSYRPGPRLKDLIRTTWPRCSYPGCATRAVQASGNCELDHTVPWPQGPTCACNLSPLCKKHHQMKTFGRITLTPSTDPHDPPGTLHWRLPTGRTYTSRPDRMTIDTSSLQPPPAPPPPPPPYNPDDDPPPF